MLKIGDTVAHFFAMHRPGKVLRIVEQKGIWMVGGVSSKLLVAEVQHLDNGEVLTYQLSDLRTLDM
jgi:predicted 2-oxoglutarate/Fe(II)-dependent dioxygenase YbiX